MCCLSSEVPGSTAEVPRRGRERVLGRRPRATPALGDHRVAAPATNFGFALVTTNADGTRFSTKENSDAATHAYLRVTHTP